MRNKIKILSGIICTVMLIVAGLYIYISSGEKVEDRDISWLTDHPIAHRGLHNDKYPENSMGAFKNAVENGYPIELDVIFTKDKQVVVFHDTNLGRVTDDKRDISEVNYSELSTITLLESNQTIPTLKEVLEMVNGEVPIVIEIKDCKDTIKLGEEIYNIVKDYSGDYCIQSFNPFVLEWYKNNAKDVIRGQLSGAKKGASDRLKSYEEFALRNLMLNFKSKPNFIAYEYMGLPKLRISMLRSQGIPVIGWTIKSKEEAGVAYKYCDNIIMENFEVN